MSEETKQYSYTMTETIVSLFEHERSPITMMEIQIKTYDRFQTQIPCFQRAKSLESYLDFYEQLSDEEKEWRK